MRQFIWLEREGRAVGRDIGPADRAFALQRMATSHERLAALDGAFARSSEGVARQVAADPFSHLSEALRLRHQALEDAVRAQDPALKGMAHDALARQYASQGVWELALPHADQADLASQVAMAVGQTILNDEVRRQFDQNVEHTARDRRLRLFELSVDQSDLVKARELLKHPLLKEEAPAEADQLRVGRARLLFESRDAWETAARATERMTEIAHRLSRLGLPGESAATGVLLSRQLLDTGETARAMHALVEAEGAALTAGDHYLRGVVAWGWAEAIAQHAEEHSGGMDPIRRTDYENRLKEARTHLDQAERPEAALLGRSPPKLVLRLSDLWYLRDPWPG